MPKKVYDTTSFHALCKRIPTAPHVKSVPVCAPPYLEGQKFEAGPIDKEVLAQEDAEQQEVELLVLYRTQRTGLCL